jgi:hypothetical protein
MYSRTDNGDGTFDSRCLHCLMTVARDAHTPAQLSRLESRHICVEMALFQLMHMQQSLVGKQQRVS